MSIKAMRSRSVIALTIVCSSSALAIGAEPNVGLGQPGANVEDADAAPSSTPEPPRDRRLSPVSDTPNYPRAALEVLGVVALGFSEYWIDAGANRQDWDHPHWAERVSGSNIRFDNNTPVTNQVLHPLAGGSYYWFARANGLSVAAASAYTLTASALWEFALEWREKASINDMVTTTFAGIAVGEFLNQLSSYLNSAPGPTNVAQDVAKSTLGFPVWVNQKLDGREPLASSGARDNLGLSAAYRHRFSVGYDSSWLSDTAAQRQQIGGVALGAQLASLAGYGEPEAFATTFAGGNFASASLDLGFDKQGFREARLAFDATLLGYYAQQGGPERLGGLIGLASGMEFLTHDTLHASDEYALVHCFGPELRGNWQRKGYGVQLRTRVYADFASIHSLVWPAVHSADPNAVYKSSLTDQGYQFNLGVMTRGSLEVRAQMLRFLAEFGYGGYRSIQGLDRFQEEITRDLPGTERIADYRVGVELDPPHVPIGIWGRAEGALHESELGGKSAKRRETRWVAGTGFVF